MAELLVVSPGDTPAIITQYVARMERQFNACQTPGPKIVCFLTQSVQLTLSSVQLTLLECVM